MLLAFTKAPEWAMDEKEAQQVAEAAVNVSRHYNVATTQKAIDWTNFAMCIGAVYGTRLIAASRRKKSERENVNAPQTINPDGVLHFPQPGMQQ